MDLKYENCPHCFSQKSEGPTCPVCGFRYNKINSQPDNVLPVFTSLNNRYLIGHCLGKGGFGITYAALDLVANVRCAIKEYFPSEFAVRNKENNYVSPVQTSKAVNVFEHAKSKFIEEARLLYQLRTTPNVVRLYNYFTENGTAYLVMEFLEGYDLREFARMCGGRIPFDMAVDVIDSCATALSEVHAKGFLHRDISPDNIYVRTKSNNTYQYLLIDFGAARNFIGNNAQTVLLKPGFAPPEAYSKTGNKGAWTDIYSLAATIYNVLSGQKLIDALYISRGAKQPTLAELGINVPREFSNIIESAMQLDPRQRPQSAMEFRNRVLNCVGKRPSQQPQTTANSGGGYYGGGSNSGVQQPPRPPVSPVKKYVAKLIIVDGPKNGQSITVQDGQTVKIGRSMVSSDFVLDYISEISRVHCTASFNSSEKALYLTDMSVNGTFMENNERLYRDRSYRFVSGQKFFLVRRDCMIMVKIEEEG